MKLYIQLVTLLLVMLFVSCHKEEDVLYPSSPEPAPTPIPPPVTTADAVQVKIGNNTYGVTLYENSTGDAFKALFPLTMNMNELNNNEKFYYLSAGLPTSSRNPGIINSGDIMLYGSDCIVLFYKTFTTGYNYTPIGKIDNPIGLENAVGKSNIMVTFEIIEQP